MGFEFLFAWAVFTAVLGKSAEAVTHAWKGTVPPSHLRRMARIRAREAKSARRDVAPSEGFRGWARTVWADSWNEATERHKERWPDKAAKKREAARARWAWWDDVEEEAGRRWDERRQARRTAPNDDTKERKPGTRFTGWETPERYGRRMAWEDLTDAERELWLMEKETDPLRRADDAGERGRLSGQRQRVRDQMRRTGRKTPPQGGSPEPSDTSDATPETPGQGPNGGVRDPRTPGRRPASGAGPTIPSTRVSTDTTEGADDMAEVINLEGATKFSRALDKSYRASMERLEEVTAWLRSEGITSGPLHDRFTAILRTTADVTALTEKAVASCEEQLKVRDAIEAAGGDAMSKEALTRG